MLSLSSTNPSAWSSSLGRPAGQVAAPQPQAGMLAGLAGVAAATEQVSPESSDDGQDDHMPAEMSFTSISSLSSLSTSYGKPATAAAGEQHFPAQGPAQRACQLPKLNTSFSHVPASSSSAPSHQNHLYASPLDCSKPLSSATSMRNRSLKPTASLSFADSLSSWSMDCMGPPLEDSASHNEPASHFKPHKADSSMRNVPDIAFPPTPPPESRPRVVRQQSQARPPPRAPALEQQQIDPSDALWDQHKASFLDSLVDVSILALKSIWPSDNEAETSSASEQLLPLHYFIRETLRRSRANAEVLQLALYYLHKGRAAIRKRVSHMMETRSRFQELSAEKERQQHATAYPSPPSSPLDSRYNHAAAEFLKSSRDPVVCGRRMFLAALIIASKFIQDRTYSNRAWARLSGLSVQDVSLYERSLLGLLDYELYVSGDLFKNWHSRLCRLQEQQGISPQAKKMPALQKTQSECSPLNTMATDHGVHAPSKPVFSPSQMPQARHIRDEHSRLGRSNSHSDVSSAAASRPTFFGSSSVGQEQRQRRTSTSAPAAAPSPTPKARNPMAPARVPTPIRSSSRNSIHRPASASLDFGHCKPALNVFSRESSWMPARHGMVAY